MQLAMIGLGRMGGNMVQRLLRGGHELVVFDRSTGRRAELREAGRHGARRTSPSVVPQLRAPRVVWVMVPAGAPTESTIAELVPALSSRATSSSTAATRTSTTPCAARRSSRQQGIEFIDAGTSGGIWGLEVGYCLMVGGAPEAVQQLRAALQVARAGGRLRARRAAGRRPLRQDGPQRHRVRHDAGLRRGLRDHARSRSFRPRPARRSPGSGSTAASCAPGCWSWPSAPSSRTPTRRHQGLRRRLRRGPLDGAGGDRPGRAGAGDHLSLLQRFRSRQDRLLQRQGDRRAAQRVRRPRGEGRMTRRAGQRRARSRRVQMRAATPRQSERTPSRARW